MASRDDDDALRQRLRVQTIGRIAFTAEAGAFGDVLRFLRAATGVPIVVSSEARRIIAEERLVLELEVRAPLAVASFLDLVVAGSDGLAWTVRNGVVEIGSKAAAAGGKALRLHDVRDLVFARTEFLPPIIGGLPNGDGTRRGGGEGDERVRAIEPDQLIALVRTATDPSLWQDDAATIEYLDSGYLLVNAPAATQRAVAAALAAMR